MFIEDKALGESQEPSLDGFIGFLQGKPANESYVWPNSHECACGQYLKSIGQFKENWLHVGRDDVMFKLNRLAGGEWDPQKWDGAGGYNEGDWTFGSCLERAKKAKEFA